MISERDQRYLEELELTTAVVRRVDQLARLALQIMPTDSAIDRIFISEFPDQDGNQVLDAVWFQSGIVLAKAHNMMTQQSIDVVRIKANIHSYRYQCIDYRPGQPRDKSRLVVHFSLDQVSEELKASDRNCEFLHALVTELLVPNLSPA